MSYLSGMPSPRASLAAALAALLVPLTAVAAADTSVEPGAGEGGAQDAVVVAVIDSGFSPYHQDYLASTMPQAQDGDVGNDLPLDRPPHEWLPEFPDPGYFQTGYSPLNLSVGDVEDPTAEPAALTTQDAAQWDTVTTSTSDAVDYRWIPGTKVIGALTFGTGKIRDTTGAHGMGTASSATGNLYGTCPSCLLLFMQYGDAASAEDAIGWAMRQSWIDVISNSYGFSLVNRDRFYAGSDTGLQSKAVERGQQIFFSAGNGQENAFLAPNATLFSSQEGPDWVVTVTASHPRNKGSYTGTGKPADVAGIGTDYPTSYKATNTVNGTSFGGTSNATPQVAGIYAEALYRIRTAMEGPSRRQQGGSIATGRLGCGAVRPDCELADGDVTGRELRDRLLQSSVSTGNGFDVGSQGIGAPSPRVLDTYRAAEGHGTWFGRWAKDRVDRYDDELDRLVKPVLGTALPPARPQGEREYFVADSACRQHLWGEWGQGYWDGQEALPAADPLQPTRTFLAGPCRSLPSLLSRDNPTS
jgi:hypothetical protein